MTSANRFTLFSDLERELLSAALERYAEYWMADDPSLWEAGDHAAVKHMIEELGEDTE